MSDAVKIIVIGLLLGTVFTFGAQISNASVTQEECMVVETEFVDGGVVLNKNNNVELPVVYDISLKEQPDLAQTLVVSCLLMNVPFKFTGLENLKIKETDRIQALINECRKLGFVVKELTSGVLSWDGEKCAIMRSAKEGANAVWIFGQNCCKL